MIPKGLFSQIIIIGLALGIVFTYIQPTLTNIQETQSEIAQYQNERQKITAVNSLLVSQVSRLGDISAVDKKRLVTYIPDDVDTVGVPRTIQAIAQQAGVLFKGVVYESVMDSYLKEQTGMPGTYPIPHVFNVTVDGTYLQIKEMLRLMEQNDFPLEVHGLDIAVLEGGFLSADMQVVTYANNLPPTSQFVE